MYYPKANVPTACVASSSSAVYRQTASSGSLVPATHSINGLSAGLRSQASTTQLLDSSAVSLLDGSRVRTISNQSHNADPEVGLVAQPLQRQRIHTDPRLNPAAPYPSSLLPSPCESPPQCYRSLGSRGTATASTNNLKLSLQNRATQPWIRTVGRSISPIVRRDDRSSTNATSSPQTCFRQVRRIPARIMASSPTLLQTSGTSQAVCPTREITPLQRVADRPPLSPALKSRAAAQINDTSHNMSATPTDCSCIRSEQNNKAAVQVNGAAAVKSCTPVHQSTPPETHAKSALKASAPSKISQSPRNGVDAGRKRVTVLSQGQAVFAKSSLPHKFFEIVQEMKDDGAWASTRQPRRFTERLSRMDCENIWE